MSQRRHHYERAFEAYLRARRTPYVSVNEAKRALLPKKPDLHAKDGSGRTVSLKSFDFVIYGSPMNLLVEIKGRKVGRSAASKRRPAGEMLPGTAGSPGASGMPAIATPGRLESWATLDDIAGLERWQSLFGEGFRAVLVFVYLCEQQPPDVLFQEVFEHERRWYAVRSVAVDAYRAHMVTRSEKWGTVHVPTADFERISSPLISAAPDAATRPRARDDWPGPAGASAGEPAAGSGNRPAGDIGLGRPPRLSATPALSRAIRETQQAAFALGSRRRLHPGMPTLPQTSSRSSVSCRCFGGSRRSLLRLTVAAGVLAIAAGGMSTGSAAAQDGDSRILPPTVRETGSPPTIVLYLVTTLLAAAVIGANLTPSKRGHQD